MWDGEREREEWMLFDSLVEFVRSCSSRLESDLQSGIVVRPWRVDKVSSHSPSLSPVCATASC